MSHGKTAFYIEDVAGVMFRTLDGNGMPAWTSDRNEALGFTNHYHADVFAADDPEDVRIREWPYVTQGRNPGLRAPVQGYAPGIPWELHLEAYEAYSKKWSPQPALIDLKGRNCRGGFSTGELDGFIPGWRERLPEMKAQRDYVASLEEQIAALQQKVAEAPYAAVAAIKFALDSDEGFDWLSWWNEGEFEKCRKNWPDAPDTCYIGADPLFKPALKVKTELSPEGKLAMVEGLIDSMQSDLAAELSDCEVAMCDDHRVVLAVSRNKDKPGHRICNLYVDNQSVTHIQALDILTGRPKLTPEQRTELENLDADKARELSAAARAKKTE